ncbi:MAG: DUF5916 domain-containing protein [Gemmatimonadales bacterium]
MIIAALAALAAAASPGDTGRPAAERPTITAVAAAEPVRLDGVLDDAVWRGAQPVSGFVQSEPSEGRPSSEKTEVWVAFDRRNLYIAAYLHDGDPAALITNDIKKDFKEEDQDDFEVLLDTFGDRQNGYVFITNVAGAKSDKQVANEGREVNASWDAVWSVETRRVEDGWTLEMAIPFRSLRFDPASGRPWGVNFSRRIRRRNEVTFWAPVPRSFNLTRVSLAGDLTGLDLGRSGRNLRIKPYVAGRTVRETGLPGFDQAGDAGLDVKAGIGSGLTLDATFNPDFAQVEADEQQVNLTQFSQFFPEKREFFLENSGIFYVGDAARNNRVTTAPTPDEDLLLFFSRRIGLDPSGRTIAIPAGVRLTGKAGGFTVGALSMQTKGSTANRPTNYGVFRLRRSFRSGSDFGVTLLNRQATDVGDDFNRVVSADANIRFFGRLDWNSYLVGTDAPGTARGQYAWRTSLNYESNFFHGKAGVLQIGEGFRDDLGYYRRTAARKYLFDIGIRPRPEWLKQRGVREDHPHIVWDFYEDLAGRSIAYKMHTGNTFFMSNGAFWELSVNPARQVITAPFQISPDVDPIPAGRYDWTEYMLYGSSDPSRVVSLSLRAILGGLWSGTQKTVSSTLTLRPNYRFRMTAGLTRTSADLDRPADHFTATLLTARANYSFSTGMFLDALTQYDPERHLFNANVRFNLIHHPLSDLFIVFNEQRLTPPDQPDLVPGRSVIVKFTQMLAF